MCGLWGAIKANGAHFIKIDKYMQQGLWLSALRGIGGTGVGLVDANFDTDVAKSYLPSPSFICSEEWDFVDKNLFQSRVILGHTRSATIGGISSKNAHPFRYSNAEGDQVMAIHNGHIRNHTMLTPASFTHPVDSAHATHSLLVNGPIPTLEKIEGAYVLIWYDSRTKMVHMARNTERELYFALTEDKTRLYFGSEVEMLQAVLRRNDIPHRNEFFELDDHTLYSYDLTKPTLAPSKKVYEEKKSYPALQGYQNSNGSSSKSNGSGGTYIESPRRDYGKAHPTKGDFIYVKIFEEDLTLFKPIGPDPDDPNKEVTVDTAYGHVFGTRAMNIGSVVRVVGVKLTEWQSKWKDIKYSLPCKIVNVTWQKTEAGYDYPYYTVKVDKEDADTELIRVRKYFNKNDNNPRVPIGEQHARALLEKHIASCIAARDGITQSDPLDDPARGDLSGDDKIVATVVQAGSVGTESQRGNDQMGPGRGSGDAVERGGLLDCATVNLLPDRVPGPKGTKILLREWRDIAAQRCYICDGALDDCDIGKVEWWMHPSNHEDRKPEDVDYQMICPACKDDPRALERLVA